jgi:CRP-like cAMP-binding protein
MELTLAAAFSPGGLVGNLSYVLLIASMAMRNMFWLRVLAIFSGIAGIAYDVIWLRDPVGAFWETTFTLTNIVQWLLLVREDRRLLLSENEGILWRKYFPRLRARECKKLLLASTRTRVRRGDKLIRHGESVSKIYMLLSGDVSIQVEGREVSRCDPGDLLGEMSFLTGEPASADTVMLSDGDLLEISQDQLSNLVRSSEDLGSSISQLLSSNLVNKLRKQNLRNLNAAPDAL